MKIPAFVISTVLVSLLAVSRSEVIEEPENGIATYSVIDPIIKAILEGMRPKLANLKVKDINEQVRNPALNATVSVKNIMIQNLDSYKILILKSTVLPLKLNNLTLIWQPILATAEYDVDATIAVPQLNAPVRIYGKGNARVALYGTYLTVGANMELKDKAVQVKPKGLFGFDIDINNANVSLSSLMGNPDLGKAVGEFVGRIIPDLVDTLKKPFFDAFQDTIIAVINDVLKGHPTVFMDEEFDLPELSFDDDMEVEEEVMEDSDEEVEPFPEEDSDFEEAEAENTDFEA